MKIMKKYSSWEEEFDKKYAGKVGWIMVGEVKDLIRSLLSQARKEGIEECEEIIKKQSNPFKKDWDYPYDQCIADILFDLSELKKKGKE